MIDVFACNLSSYTDVIHKLQVFSNMTNYLIEKKEEKKSFSCRHVYGVVKISLCYFELLHVWYFFAL